MSATDTENDPVLAALRGLRTCDVGPAHAQRLRSRCHSGLETRDSSRHSPAGRDIRMRQRVAGAVGAVWCVLYLLETIRRAAAVYGF